MHQAKEPQPTKRDTTPKAKTPKPQSENSGLVQAKADSPAPEPRYDPAPFKRIVAKITANGNGTKPAISRKPLSERLIGPVPQRKLVAPVEPSSANESGTVRRISVPDRYADPAFLATKRPIQAKLMVGPAKDRYEQEADRVASQVVQTINSPDAGSIQREGEEDEDLQMKPQNEIQRQDEEDEDLQMKFQETLQRVGSDGGAVSQDLETEIKQAKGSGQPLDAGLQQSMGQAMGADFSNVKIHADSQADQLNQSIQAKAFTTGQDVFFRQGNYNPGSPVGQELIAHELTHVVQQNGNSVQRQEDRLIQRDVYDEDGEYQDQSEVVKYLVENGANTDAAIKLAKQCDDNPGYYIFRSQLLEFVDKEEEFGNLVDFAEQAGTLNEGKIDTLHLANLFRRILVLDAQTAKKSDKEVEERSQMSDEEALKAISTTCDVNAYVMMVGAVGIEDLEKIKAKYSELYKQRMKNPQSDNTSIQTEDGKGTAHLFLQGEAQKLRSTWQKWTSQKSNGAMKVKFDQAGGGPHTLVVERTDQKVALYQAYEGKYTLGQSLQGFKDKGGKPVKVPRSGVLVSPSEVEQNQINLLCQGLGTPEDVKALKEKQPTGSITSEMYQAAFGAPLKESWRKDYGAAITAVSLLAFDNLLGSKEVNQQLESKLDKVKYYEEIIPIDEYDKQLTAIFSQGASQKEIEEQKKRTEESRKNPKAFLANLSKGNFKKLKKAKTEVKQRGDMFKE